MDDSDTQDYLPLFPKPKRKEKPRKGLNKVRPAGKRNFNREQKRRSREAKALYSQVSRPRYLLELAQRQGRLKGPLTEDPKAQLLFLPSEEQPRCEVGELCGGNNVASTIHHKQGRLGPLLNDPTHFLGSCMRCHRHLEKERKQAQEEGWSERRNDVEEG